MDPYVSTAEIPRNYKVDVDQTLVLESKNATDGQGKDDEYKYTRKVSEKLIKSIPRQSPHFPQWMK